MNNESYFIPLSCGNWRQNTVGLSRKTSAGVHLDDCISPTHASAERSIPYEVIGCLTLSAGQQQPNFQP